MNMFYAENRESWKKWLEENYNREKEIGLVYYKKSSGKSSISYDESVEEALCFGWIDGVRKGIDEEKYFLRFTPRRPKSIWSMANVKRVAKLIEEGKMMSAGLKAVEEGKISGEWDKAYSLKANHTLPLEFEEALNKNLAALDFFNSLSNTDKHAYITHSLLKDPLRRAERINKIIELLEKKIKPYVGKKPSYSVYK